MASNHTEHIDLPQWVGTDEFSMAEFNDAFQKIDTAVGGLAGSAVKTATGSYVGTGTYGIANKITLQFDFAPKLLIVLAEASAYTVFQMVALRGMPRAHTSMYSTSNDYDSTVLNWSGNTVSYYSDSTNSSSAIPAQFNINGKTYTYFAIG